MADLRRNIGIPSGVVFPFAGGSAPYGYLICDGRAVSRSDYADLFMMIGTSHGIGNGSTTFNLPDYRGRFLRGVDGLAGVDPDKDSRIAMASGGNTGNAVGSVQSDQLKSHAHTYTDFQNMSSGGSGSNFSFGAGGTPQYQTYTSNATGGNETRPQNVYVNYIIKI